MVLDKGDNFLLIEPKAERRSFEDETPFFFDCPQIFAIMHVIANVSRLELIKNYGNRRMNKNQIINIMVNGKGMKEEISVMPLTFFLYRSYSGLI